MQTALSRIWTQVTVSIAYNGNYYTTDTYVCIYMHTHTHTHIHTHIYIYIYIYICPPSFPWLSSLANELTVVFSWKCPWCNGYRRRNWTRRYEFKSWTRLIAFHIALIPLGKVWIQLFSLQLWVNSRTD